MHVPITSFLFVLSLVSTLPAQLSGTYTIDPSGSGSRNFKSFPAASFALFIQGTSSSVIFDIAAGTYTAGVTIYPVSGSSSSKTVTFRSPTKGAAVFDVKNYIPFSFIPISSVYPSWFVFDGIDFRTSTTGATAFNTRAPDIVVRNCSFDRCYVTLTGARCEIHHCRFSGRSRQLAVNGASSLVHHNEIRVTNSNGGFATFSAPYGKARSRIWNNVFWGTVTGGNSESMTLSGPVDFVHNTIVELAFQSPHWHPTVRISTRFAMVTEFSNNIVVNLNAGYALEVYGGYSSFYANLKNNLYWAPKSPTRFNSSLLGKFSDLASWQRATGQDAGSQYVDPQFVDINTSPAGLKLKNGSSAVGKASGTPSYVDDDFGGSKRQTPATIGAYEGFPKSTFVPFGKGCAGAMGYVPEIGYLGTLQMGSTNFAVTLMKAKGGGVVNAWFVVGGTKTSIPFGGSCTLVVTPHVLVLTGVSGTAPGNGFARIPIVLPNDPKLRGAKAHFQWAVMDSAATGGAAFSNAATLTL